MRCFFSTVAVLAFSAAAVAQDKMPAPAFGVTVGGQAIGIDPATKTVKLPPDWTAVGGKMPAPKLAKIESLPAPKLATHAANCSCGAACDCPSCDGSCPKATAGVTYTTVCEGGVCRLVPVTAPRTLSYSGPLVSGGVTVGGGCADGSCAGGSCGAGFGGSGLFPRARGLWDARPRLFFR